MPHIPTTILVFVGLAGSGVSTAVTYCSQKGIPKVDVNALIDTAFKSENYCISPEVRDQFRDEHRTYLIQKAIEQITRLSQSGQHTVVLDGLYSWTELKVLKKHFPGEVTTIALFSPLSLRHRRLAERTKEPLTQSKVDARDRFEIECLEKGGPIATAKHIIYNDAGEDALFDAIDTIVTAT